MKLAYKGLRFFSSNITVPVVDIKSFLTGSPNYNRDCKTVAESLQKYGCLVIKDPRVEPQLNNKFLDQMETYFSKRANDHYAGKTVKEFYP